MDDNAEEGISRTQLANAGDLGKRQRWNIAYLDERILIYLGALVFLGLGVVWLTAKSTLVLYGSLGLAVLLVVLWGIARINSIKRLNEERERQARDFSSR